MKLKVNTVIASQNSLARFLAEDGAANRTRLVVFRRSFDQVRNPWCLDMGLGGGGAIFEEISEDEYDEPGQEEAVQDPMETMESGNDEVDLLVQGVDQPNMGARL